MIEPVYEQDGVTLYHADCLDVLPTLGGVDAVVTDPPYGIGYVHSGKGSDPKNRPPGGVTRRSVPIEGDSKPFDPSPWLAFQNVLMWGANHYANRLPPSGRWLAWSKIAGMEVHDSFGDVDFAWHSIPGAARIINFGWKGIACQKQGESNGRRWHPSQKPVAVMKWSIEQASVGIGGTILDPFAGSGTTGVACLKTGRRCILIEKDERYIPVIIKRLKDAETPLFAGMDSDTMMRAD